ncbi:MAG TPA: ABC transporter permease [Anaerolineae bacterium]
MKLENRNSAGLIPPVVTPQERKTETSSPMAGVKKFFARDATALLLALALMMAVFTILTPLFMSVPNMLNIARAAAISGITCAGMTLAIIAGMIDMSIGATTNLSVVVTGLAALKLGLNPWAAMACGLAVGVAVGAVNGLLITKVRINPLIATLGTMGIGTGIAFLLTNGISAGITDKAFSILGRTLVLGVPTPVIVLAVVYVLTFFVLRYTQFGRAVYAVGGNPVAARLAGINVDRWRFLIMIWCSFWAAFSGIVLLSKLGTMIPNAATGTELNIIAAVILGGTSLAGGAGSIQGTLVGILILSTLQNGLVMLNVNAYWQQIASGCALLLAVGIDQLRTGGYK